VRAMAVWASSRLMRSDGFAVLARRWRERETDKGVIAELDTAEAACISSS
jgi:hypothetical protein